MCRFINIKEKKGMKRDMLKWFTATSSLKYHGFSLTNTAGFWVIRKLYKALEEDTFRPVLHHYDGPKFRLELSVPETLDLLDLCEQAGSSA
ncbi:hypothetical protein OIU78_026005 [Salix suchowensis]|nr:hypothetical protein OIU78_026005 [Salix suchowensis]